MSNRFSRLIVLLFTLGAFSASAQVESDTLGSISTGISDEFAASPSVLGNRKPKGVELNYLYQTGFDIASEAQTPEAEDAEGRVQNMHGYEFKLKAPIVLKPRTKFIIGLAYSFYEYEFDDPENIESPLYLNLEEKSLRNAEVAFYATHSISRNRFLLGKLGFNVNGDFTKEELPFRRFIKTNLSMVYGKKLNRFTSFGFGAYFSYTFGRPQVYPAVLWNHSFNEKWGIEALLPAKLQLRRNFSTKAIASIGYSISGASYHIVLKSPPLQDIKTLELRNSDIKVFLTFEREIYDFLWFSVTGGYRYNINFNLAMDNKFNNADLLVNTVDPSPFLGFSIFLVPPKSFSTKVVEDAQSE